MWGDIAIAFLLAFIVAFMTTPYTIKIAHKIGAVDVPKDERRMHKKAMPKFGGPAGILGFLVSVIYLLIVMSMENTINLFGPESYGMKLLGMFLGIVVLSITCIIDDIITIRPIVKLFGQLVAAIIAVSFGIRLGEFNLSFLNNPGVGGDHLNEQLEEYEISIKKDSNQYNLKINDTKAVHHFGGLT